MYPGEIGEVPGVGGGGLGPGTPDPPTGGATPPTVEAGGPYEAKRADSITLDATVTPGTDPTPTNLWTIVSGGTGTFEDDTLVDAVFIPDNTGTYTLRLTVSSTDSSDVTDDATLQVTQRGSTVAQRRLQMIRRDDEEVLALMLLVINRTANGTV